MKHVTTVCARDCYDTCALIFQVDKRENIASIRADARHPLTRGIVCPRSARDMDRLRSNRIDTPHVKEGNKLREVGWDESIGRISRKIARIIAEHGPEKILFLGYAGNTGLLTSSFPKRLWHAIGATQTDNALCSKSGHAGIALHYGRSYGANPLDIPQKSLTVFWGFNASVSARHLWELAQRSRKQKQAAIVVVDPIETETAKKADLWIQPRPQTDVALVYGLLNTLIGSGRFDRAFIEKWTTGFESLKDASAKWPLEKVHQITGVSPSRLKLLADMYAANESSMTLIGYGLQHCSNGADQVRAVALVPALLGIHSGFFYGNGSAYLLDRPRIDGTSLFDRRSKIIPQVAVADHIKKGDFSLLFVSCMNPAMTLPNQNAFREGLARDDLLLVVHDTHWTETAKLADIALPAPTFLEKEDIVIPDSHNCIQISRQVVSPLADSRSEVQVMQDIAGHLKLDSPWLYEDAMTAVSSAMADAFEDGSVKDLISGRCLRLRCKPIDDYPTPSGKIEFHAETAAEQGFSPLPEHREMDENQPPFTFVTSAVPNHTHTQFQEVFGSIPAVVHINRADATRLGIATGDVVRMSNPLGRLRLQAIISDALPAGVVWSPKEAADLYGIPQNCLTSSRPQHLGKGPRLNSTRVSLRKE